MMLRTDPQRLCMPRRAPFRFRFRPGTRGRRGPRYFLISISRHPESAHLSPRACRHLRSFQQTRLFHAFSALLSPPQKARKPLVQGFCSPTRILIGLSAPSVDASTTFWSRPTQTQ
ncbi:hypothetical protein T440DRAFT_139479 [Plenodomus tracheiphilus IPT5]|uniref:Uncharacterized protein n=1 Tax=Plenodomus tracheiphilus IPT5 TaxID=1408161 RepID=A0A6A7B134_9PLEO|nr:hypothetical protein T440DRAFT_139479 [Plenodomus tracheiphilus IPT5]